MHFAFCLCRAAQHDASSGHVRKACCGKGVERMLHSGSERAYGRPCGRRRLRQRQRQRRGREVSGTGKRPLEEDEARCGPETAMIGRGVAFCPWVSSKVYSPGRYFPSTEPLRPGGVGVAARPYAVAGGVLWWQAAAVMVAAVMVGSCSGALGAGRADGDGVSA